MAATYPYEIYYPKSYQKDSATAWPLLLFLHGAGERGSDLNKVKQQGLPRYLVNKEEFPFVVAYPQCPKNTYWDIPSLNQWLSSVLEQVKADLSRVYLTGLSMGGYGTWHWGAAHPEKFAALLPICGGGNPAAAARLKNMPIWAFHGSKDTVVPVEESLQMVAAVKKAGGNAKLTLYPELLHDSWTITYKNQEIYDWLLEQQLDRDT